MGDELAEKFGETLADKSGERGQLLGRRQGDMPAEMLGERGPDPTDGELVLPNVSTGSKCCKAGDEPPVLPLPPRLRPLRRALVEVRVVTDETASCVRPFIQS